MFWGLIPKIPQKLAKTPPGPRAAQKKNQPKKDHNLSLFQFSDRKTQKIEPPPPTKMIKISPTLSGH